MDNQILQAALEYLERGWSIIPIRPGTKLPACRSWKPYQTQRPDVPQVKRWFGNGKQNGIAVVLGDVSGGLVCRDFDEMEAYERWATGYPEFARMLPTVETGRPGRHVYCLADVEQIRVASPSGGSIIHFDDGELRGGGYCLLPRSKHPSGHVYDWQVPLNGELPRLDLYKAGFLLSTPCNRENRDNREYRGLQKTTDVIVRGEIKKQQIGPNGGDLDALVERAILESLPQQTGKRNDQVWDLARGLKGVPSLCDADADSLKPYVKRWHKLAFPVIGTKPFEMTWIDFLQGWPNVKYPKGAEPMAQLMANAVQAEIPAVAVEKEYESKPLCQLVSICRELQRATGKNPFFLSCRTAGRYIGTDHTTASRYLFLLEHDKILKVITKGDQRTRKATRFRYLPDL